MKALLEYFVRKRNPNFTFSEAISSRILICFSLRTIVNLLRGLKLLVYLKNPKWATLGKSVRFHYSHKISIGKFLKTGNHVLFSALGINGIQIGNNVSIGSYSSLIASTTLNDIGEGIQIGDHVGIGEYAYLGGAGGLQIGDNCIVGQYFSCHPENHNYDNLSLEIRLQGTSRRGIIIGENCWIGSKVTILDGVQVGKGCVIAAGAVVAHSFPDHSVIGGVPAKLIKTR